MDANIIIGGEYYKKRKGYGAIPQPITITDIIGDEVMYVWTHNYVEESSMLVKNRCKAEKIIINISKKQKAILQEESEKINKLSERLQEEIWRFKEGYR